jgi:hypothetical protein
MTEGTAIRAQKAKARIAGMEKYVFKQLGPILSNKWLAGVFKDAEDRGKKRNNPLFPVGDEVIGVICRFEQECNVFVEELSRQARTDFRKNFIHLSEAHRFRGRSFKRIYELWNSRSPVHDMEVHERHEYNYAFERAINHQGAVLTVVKS